MCEGSLWTGNYYPNVNLFISQAFIIKMQLIIIMLNNTIVL